MNLGKAILLVRTQKGISQLLLADATGLSVSYISLLETNKRDPAFSTVLKIAEALEVPLVVLMFLAEDKGVIAGINQQLAEKLALLAFDSL